MADIDYQRIIKECFWDLDMNEEKIKEIVDSGDFRKKMFLFDKILVNSSKLFQDLAIFNRKELKKLTDNYKIPEFNKEFIYKRKNMVEVFFFDKPLMIDELQWKI